MAGIDNLTPWKKGQSGNPAGPKPGYKHISTWIEDMLNDEEFEANLIDSKHGVVEFKGAPLKAIIKTAIHKAINGDKSWADWLANNGYGSLLKIQTEDPRQDILEKYGLGVEGADEKS